VVGLSEMAKSAAYTIQHLAAQEHLLQYLASHYMIIVYIVI